MISSSPLLSLDYLGDSQFSMKVSQNLTACMALDIGLGSCQGRQPVASGQIFQNTTMNVVVTI